jgi:hypothetical protein
MVSFLGLLILGMLISYFSVSLLLNVTQYAIIHSGVECFFWALIIGSICYIGKTLRVETSHYYYAYFWNRCWVWVVLWSQHKKMIIYFCIYLWIIGSQDDAPWTFWIFVILLGNYVLLLVDSVNTLLYRKFICWWFLIHDDQSICDYLRAIVFSLKGYSWSWLISHFLSFFIKEISMNGKLFLGFIMGSLGVGPHGRGKLRF